MSDETQCADCDADASDASDVEEKDLVVAPKVIKTSKIWMKDSQGHPSISVTMLAISFWVTTLAYILSMVSKIGPVEIRPFDVGACGAYFGLILSTYVARRFTEAKYGNPNVPYNPYTNSYQQPYTPPYNPYAQPEQNLPPLGPRAGKGK